MTIDDPAVVRAQYASEDGLLTRRSVYEGSEGVDTREVVFEAVAECAPRRVLEVGCGPGELAERIGRELAADVVAIDISPRMVQLARERGVDARLGDAARLPFPDESFDCAVAAWMLFHVPDLPTAVAELARVLRLDGRLVAATNAARHLEEVWGLVGGSLDLSFSRENGADVLGRSFAQVERRDVDGWVTFRDRAAVCEYIASTVTRAHLAATLPAFDGPVRASRRNSVFVAEKG